MAYKISKRFYIQNCATWTRVQSRGFLSRVTRATLRKAAAPPNSKHSRFRVFTMAIWAVGCLIASFRIRRNLCIAIMAYPAANVERSAAAVFRNRAIA